MLEHDAGIVAVSKLLGHSKLSTTERYTHLSPATMMKAYHGAFPSQPVIREQGGRKELESSALVCSQLPLRRETTKPNTEFQDVTSATVVVIELQSRAKNATRMIKDAGGIVFRTYRSAPSSLQSFRPKKSENCKGFPVSSGSTRAASIRRSALPRLEVAEKSQNIITSTIPSCFCL